MGVSKKMTKFAKKILINILNKFGFYLLFTAIISLPFSNSISSILMGLMFIITVINPAYYKTFELPSLKDTYGQIFYLSLLFFSFHILSIFNSENFSNALFKIQIKIPFLIFPLIFIYKNPIIKQNIKKPLLAFVFGSLANVVYIIIAALYRSIYMWNNKLAFHPWTRPYEFDFSILELIQNGVSEFTYANLSHFSHPTYIAMYITLSIAILFYFLKTHEFKQKYLRLSFKILIVVFSLIIILLNSRAGILTLTFIITLSLFLQIFKYKKYVSGILYSILFSSLIYFATYHTRISRHIQPKTTQISLQNKKAQISLKQKKNQKPKNSRLVIWESAFGVASENLLFGVGISDVKKELYNYNKIKQLSKNKGHYYDAHNQFLHSLVGLGIFGLIVLCLIFFFPLLLSINQKRYLLFSQIAIVGINSLFESILERSYGMLFFALFFFLFLAYSPSYEDKFKIKS